MLNVSIHHVQNTCSDNILFTNESHHEYARTLISRTYGTSPTQIDNWHVAPKKWHHKLKPKATNRTCVNTTREMGSQTKAQSNQRHLCQHMEKWSRPPHPRPSTPFGSTLQTTCHPRSRHTERPQFEVKSSMSIARVGCGNFAWNMGTNPSNLVNTDISSQKNNSVCQFYVRVAISLWFCLAARMRSPETVSNHLPPFLSHRTSTSKREIGCRPQSSSRSLASQSNTWCVAAFRAAATKARSSKCEPSIRPRTCRHISLCRNMSKAEVPSSFHARTPLFVR